MDLCARKLIIMVFGLLKLLRSGSLFSKSYSFSFSFNKPHNQSFLFSLILSSELYLVRCTDSGRNYYFIFVIFLSFSPNFSQTSSSEPHSPVFAAHNHPLLKDAYPSTYNATSSDRILYIFTF